MQEFLTLTETECCYVEGVLSVLEKHNAPPYPTIDGAGQWIIILMNALNPKECLYFSRFNTSLEVLAAFYLTRSSDLIPEKKSSLDSLLFKES